MRPAEMPPLQAIQLGTCANAGLAKDKDFTKGYRILDAEFHRDKRTKTCYWVAKVRSPTGGFAVTFDSQGIRNKTPIPYL